MNEYNRARIRLVTNQDAVEFVSTLNTDGTATRYSLENFDGKYRVNARSLLGVLYFVTEHNDDTFFVNDEGGDIPNFVDKYRPTGSK